MTQRRVAVLQLHPLPEDVLLYRTEQVQGPFSYPSPHNPVLHDHPLRLLFEHLMMGRVPPPVMALRSIVSLDSVVATFLYLYPDRINHPEIGTLVDIVCRYERWGSVGTFPSVAPHHRYVLQALSDVLPSEEDHVAMGDQVLTNLLIDAVQILHGSFPLDVELMALDGVESVEWETDRIAVVIAQEDAPADLWDGIFLAGKLVAAVLRPKSDGQTTVAIIRRSVLVRDLDFTKLFKELAYREAGWHEQTDLALLGPVSGSRFPLDELVNLIKGARIC